MKKVKYYILGLTTGLILFSSIGVFAINQILSNEVLYDNTNSNLNSTNVKDAIDELYNVCNVRQSLSSKIVVGTTGTHNGYTYSIVNEGNGIRYEGKDPANYVCFSSSCTADTLYRIIGKFNVMVDTTGNGTADTSKSVIKLIKSKAFSESMYWASGASNTWSTASINTYINSTWTKPTNNILTARWYVGGYSTPDATAATFLSAESNGTTWDGKVGLMYVSDYGYAVLSTNCGRTTNMSSYNSSNCYSNNWIYYGSESISVNTNYSMSITPYSGGNYQDYYISGYSGGIARSGDYNFGKMGVKPVFYLDATTTKISSGTGTSSDPYIIN